MRSRSGPSRLPGVLQTRVAPDVLRRLTRGGLPAVAANALNVATPLVAVLYLTPSDYAFWALAATLLTTLLVLDFGGAALTINHSAGRRLTARALYSAIAVTTVPALAISALCVVLWDAYASVSSIAVDPRSAKWSLAAVGLGAALRSTGVILASVALGREQFIRRALVLLSGSLVGVSTTVVLLALGAHSLALGCGAVAAGGTQVVVGAFRISLDGHASHPPVHASGAALRFVRAKGLVAVLALFVSQFDRWVVGIVATPATLAAYDVAARLTSLPKIALITFMTGLVAETRRARERGGVSAVLRLARSALTMSGLTATVLVVPVAVCALLVVDVDPDIAVLVVVATALSNTVHALTIGPVMILTGLGRPEYELRYMAWLAAGVALSYGLGIVHHSAGLVIVGGGLATVSASVWFVRRTTRHISAADGG